MIFNLKQASEFCPHFKNEDIIARKDFDPYLIDGLMIAHLFSKTSEEMSGGEKQRMNLYLSLTSNTPIILLDEIFSEISVIPTDTAPDGIRSRVINTICNWSDKKYKLIIIVGHGVFDNYSDPIITKFKLIKNIDNTNELIPL